MASLLPFPQNNVEKCIAEEVLALAYEPDEGRKISKISLEL